MSFCVYMVCLSEFNIDISRQGLPSSSCGKSTKWMFWIWSCSFNLFIGLFWSLLLLWSRYGIYNQCDDNCSISTHQRDATHIRCEWTLNIICQKNSPLENFLTKMTFESCICSIGCLNSKQVKTKIHSLLAVGSLIILKHEIEHLIGSPHITMLIFLMLALNYFNLVEKKLLATKWE